MPTVDHPHDEHSHLPADSTAGNIRMAFFLNLGFTILEIIGGILTNSIAIIANAIHNLGDSAALGLAWYMEHIAQRGSDRTYTDGYQRFSLLGALINGGVLIGGALLVLSEALPRLFSPEPPAALGMIGFAILGILVNGAAVLRLRSAAGFNTRTVMLHLLADMPGRVGVLLVGSILLYTDWYFLDPLLSLLITGFVLYNVVKNMRQALRILLQGTPRGADCVMRNEEGR